jgi:hypothetical protein
MAYSGVHATELKKLVAWLKRNKATDIKVFDDDRDAPWLDEYTKEECPNVDHKGPWHVVEYKK